MIIFDYFFYIFYTFFNEKLKRKKEDAILSAISFLSLYIAICINVLNNTIGLITKNNVTYYFTEKKPFLGSYFIIMATSYLIFGIRYYRLYSTDMIGEKLLNVSNGKRIVFKYIIVFILISMPILSFMTFRLYKFGHL